ncbi:MAG: acyl carrier protein [Candidatus Tagabacteria bacterium RIFCSPLOWO2_01_FULL_39_11]|uniref:Acyl carrier protein n=1 Tax=Candidatus Tagabacteria bacterium RIFCSPLOWO2_01_FULL_39_11 TaxID=1802295 RepID=A0A1G2LNH9_9BACT|nr:MAG: acyl carrier protein [Candidatus Tagabacteria bacterium RIFCSPLOWO2_01_FULL_39_11]
MKPKKVEEKVIKVIIEQLGVNKNDVRIESNIAQDLGADSLDMVELMMALEEEFEEFKITIPDEEAQKMLTVGDVIKYIHIKTNWPPTAPPPSN